MRHLWHNLTHWLGSRDHLVLIAAVMIAGGTWGFIELMDAVRAGGTQRFDEWAVRTVAGYHGPRWLEEVGRDITALGGVAILTLITAFVVGFLILRKKYHAAWFLLFATIGGVTLSSLLKHLVSRPRPDVVPWRSYVVTTSFPSGHSMLSATVYLTLGSLLARYTRDRALRLYFLAAAMFLAFLVGLSRVYMGVHYPTDVLAGWTAGGVWALLCWLAARILQRRGKVERDLES